MTDQGLTILLSVVSGGGLVAIIQAIAGRNKNRSEVTDINVKTAIKLQQVAMERYDDATKNLEAANQYLAEVRRELDVYRNYINVLEDLLIKNRIELPERPKL